MIEYKVKNGYGLYNWYQFLFQKYMFADRYKYVSHKLLKRFIAYKYVQGLRGN